MAIDGALIAPLFATFTATVSASKTALDSGLDDAIILSIPVAAIAAAVFTTRLPLIIRPLKKKGEEHLPDNNQSRIRQLIIGSTAGAFLGAAIGMTAAKLSDEQTALITPPHLVATIN